MVEIRCRISAVKQAKRQKKEGGEGCDYEIKSRSQAAKRPRSELPSAKEIFFLVENIKIRLFRK